jgi:FixJ family two-component response regulator
MTTVDLSQIYVQERVATAMQLVRSGWFASDIAVYLGVSRRTVERYRARAKRQVGARP